MILIGSKAIKHWYPDFPREPKDVDYLTWVPPLEREPNTEYLVNDVFKSWHGYGNMFVKSTVSPNVLYTLKISHVVGWDINWDKHIFDIQFLKSKGCTINPKLFYELYSYWNTIHLPNKRSDLNMSAEDFFDNAVKCPYDHDTLHTLLNPYPTYNKVLKDGAEVDVDENKFNQLSFEEKCALVTEEVMVMAYERYSSMGYKHAYSKMLKKFILNHAPLWEAVFIIENYIELHKPKFNFYKTIENGLQTI